MVSSIDVLFSIVLKNETGIAVKKNIGVLYSLALRTLVPWRHKGGRNVKVGGGAVTVGLVYVRETRREEIWPVARKSLTAHVADIRVIVRRSIVSLKGVAFGTIVALNFRGFLGSGRVLMGFA